MYVFIYVVSRFRFYLRKLYCWFNLVRNEWYYPNFFAGLSVEENLRKWAIRFVEKIRHPDARVSLLSYCVCVFVFFKWKEVKSGDLKFRWSGKKGR
jgi:hypothetical protein